LLFMTKPKVAPSTGDATTMTSLTTIPLPPTAAEKPGDDTLSSLAVIPVNYAEITTALSVRIPSIQDGMTMDVDKLKTLLQAALVGHVVFDTAARNLVAAANRRMQGGESIGGCTTLKSFVEKYVLRPCENLESAVRRTYRLLNGVGVNEKYDSSAARAAIKAAAEEKAKKAKAKREDKEARAKLDAAAERQKSYREKSNAEAVDAALENREKITQAEIIAEAAKMQRPLINDLKLAEEKLKDAAKIAGHRADTDDAVEKLLNLILTGISVAGTADAKDLKEIYILAKKIRFKKGEN
jgi:hypothetical protein